MNLSIADITSLTEIRDSIYGLTKLDFAVYNQLSRQLVPSIAEDHLSVIGREEYNNFIKYGIENSLMRSGISIFKGPMHQYQCFIPVRFGDAMLVLAGTSLYISDKDIEEFFSAKGYGYGLSQQDQKLWVENISWSDIASISDACNNIQRMVNIFLRDCYEKHTNVEKYRRTMTVIDLLSDIDQEITEEKVFSLLTEIVTLLYKGDTVSVMVRTIDKYIPVLTNGRDKEKVKSVTIGSNNVLIADALNNRRNFICSEPKELTRLGYPEEVRSLHLFPIAVNGKNIILLSVFNTELTREDVDTLSKTGIFIGFILKTIKSQKTYGRHIEDMAALNLATVELSPSFKDTDALFDSIVEISARHMNAEKASIMVPQDDGQELFIKAVKGLNRLIADKIRVKVGEGIAGKVYLEGKAMMVTDIEKNLSKKKRSHYRTGSFVSVPLKIGSETIAVLNLADKVSGEIFSEDDMEFLRSFASYVSIALEGAHYYRMSEHLRTLSITDSLTGLFNRRYFDDRLFEEFQRAVRYKSVFSLAIFDIDDFKLFNDTEGHVAGDEVLKSIANISRESMRSIDIVARYGGEEFSVIMPQTDRDVAFQVAERLRENIRDLIQLRWEKFPNENITVSIGIATYPQDGKDMRTLIDNADKALYKAKVSGKDRTVAWTESLSEPLKDKPATDKTS